MGTKPAIRGQVRLYFRLIGAQIRSGMQYRASFVADLVGNFLVTSLDFVAVALLLTRFGAIGNWTLGEVVFLYGASSISFSISELLVGAFDGFDELVVRGTFDRVLIRPLGIVFQMMTGAFPLRRLGRLSQGLVAVGLGFVLLRPDWGPDRWLFALVMVAGGTLFFMAIFVAGATMAFWTPQSAEVANIFTYGGQFMTSYPMHIYQAWMRDLFTFVIPMAFINYYPALYLLRKPDPLGLPAWVPFLSPAIAVAVFALAVGAWRIGVRHYQSTGN